jgi:hypothetical protein
MLFLFTSILAYSQTGTIRGNIYDADSGEPIIYCNIILDGTSYGGTTDLNGFFAITGVPEGDYVMLASYIGYDQGRMEVKVKSGGVVYKNINLIAGGVNLGGVDISASREQARTEIRVSQISVSPRQIKALPSAGGEPDIAQYLQVIPGVISTGDQGGQLYIRGGAPVQNKILLDGLNIYNPFHSLGFFSVFETELIRNVDVYTGGFNAEYGGRTSAVVDISTREGSKNRFGGQASLSPFAAKVLFEGPISKFKEGGGSTSFVVTGKKALIDETSKTLYKYAAENDTVGLPFGFQDLYGKFSIVSNNGSRFNLFGFNFKDDYLNPSIADISWENSGVGANFNLIPQSSNILVNGVFGYTNYNIGIVEGLEPERSSAIKELTAKVDFTFFGDNSEINYGVEVQSISTDFDFTNPYKVRLNQNQNTTEIGTYAKFRKVFNGVVVEPGVRLQYYASPSKFSLEPRLGLKYNINDSWRFKFAGGFYTQNILSTNNDRDIVNLFTGFLTGPEETVTDFNGDPLDVKLMKSRHAIAGFEYDVNSHLTINIEGYYKDFPQIVVVNRNKLSLSDANYTVEEGNAYGVDFNFKYDFRKVYLWGTYSYGFVNRNDGIQEFPTVFDRRHNVNMLASYDIDDEGDFVFSIRWNMGSGFPFTKTQAFYNNVPFIGGIDTPYSTANPDEIGIIYSEERNGGRLPYYHRLDVSLQKTLRFSKDTSLEITAAVTNAYDRENIFYFDRIRYNRVNQLPVIPSMSVKFNF